MPTEIYRIHGDNIVECERIIKVLISATCPSKINNTLTEPSTVSWDLSFSIGSENHSWHIDLLPGFNKAGRSRWSRDVFDILRSAGSFLDETPDAIITHVRGEEEEILCAIEFCSALQAGNQAWQRSGRAYSTGIAKCPYLYIVDFVKYELDPATRERKIPRFPNPVVPYSYISYSRNSHSFIAQAYVKSEEFNKELDDSLRSFDENNFASKEIGQYLVSKMLGEDTSEIEEAILSKNKKVVQFLASSENDASKSFTSQDWRTLCETDRDIISFSKQTSQFKFHKTIAAKSLHGKAGRVQHISEKYSVGLASNDMPFGIIPKENRRQFGRELMSQYPDLSEQVFASLQDQEKDLVVCLMKGFKPRGDDNRPDRGLLPLIRMLVPEDVEILTFVYGPVLHRNLELLYSDPDSLARSNGLWNTIIRMSDYLLLDVPVLRGPMQDYEYLTTFESDRNLEIALRDIIARPLIGPLFSSSVSSLHEDDVDTAIHHLFANVLSEDCFEGMCNPPGGDWSGFSLIDNQNELRWLSLPRVSDEIEGKRPDHIIQFFSINDAPLILLIESKERADDLEADVGIRLRNYLSTLCSYIPNVIRDKTSEVWRRASDTVTLENYNILSAGAYIDSGQYDSLIASHSNCDILFALSPARANGYQWRIRITAVTDLARVFKTQLQQMVEQYQSNGKNLFLIV